MSIFPEDKLDFSFHIFIVDGFALFMIHTPSRLYKNIKEEWESFIVKMYKTVMIINKKM